MFKVVEPATLIIFFFDKIINLPKNGEFSLHIKKEALYKVLLFKKCRGAPSPIMVHPTCRNISAFKGKFKPRIP